MQNKDSTLSRALAGINSLNLSGLSLIVLAVKVSADEVDAVNPVISGCATGIFVPSSFAIVEKYLRRRAKRELQFSV